MLAQGFFVVRPAQLGGGGDPLAYCGTGASDKNMVKHRNNSFIDIVCVEVTVLDALPEFPDSCFVEDTAVLTPNCAIISNPGAPSRQKEPAYIVDAVKRWNSSRRGRSRSC